jgi:hypothetical protein
MLTTEVITATKGGITMNQKNIIKDSRGRGHEVDPKSRKH